MEQEDCASWLADSKLIKLRPGQTLISKRQLQDRIYLVVSGQVRLLVEADSDIVTLDRRGPGQFLGWASLLRGDPCEWVTCSEPLVVLALPAAGFIDEIIKRASFSSWFASLTQPQETYLVANAALDLMPQRESNWRDQLIDHLESSSAVALTPGEPFELESSQGLTMDWFVSTSGIPGFPVGSSIQLGQILPERDGYQIPYRLIGLSQSTQGRQFQADSLSSAQNRAIDVSENLEKLNSLSLHQLGILEDDFIKEEERFPIIRGKGAIQEAIAVCEMMALIQQVPFRKDSVHKILEDQIRRNKSLTLELLAGLTESLGLRTQLGSVDNAYLGSIEAPALLMLEGTPVVLFDVRPERISIGHPRQGLLFLSLQELQDSLGEQVRFALPRRIGSTQQVDLVGVGLLQCSQNIAAHWFWFSLLHFWHSYLD